MLKILKLRGTPREIGLQHGRLGKKEVINSLETYEKLFYDYKGYRWSKAKQEALIHVKAIEKYDLDMIEEMEGIAKGAGVDFEDILTLNARSEIALAMDGEMFSDGCTAISIYQPFTEDTLIAQNWDWHYSQNKSLLMLKVSSEGHPDILMVTEGGIIGKIGFNSAGVGVCFNALITNKKTDKVPIHLGLKAVLKSYTQAEALSKLSNGQIATSASFIIGYDTGEGKGMALNAEVSPFGIDFVDEEIGRLVHTNHLCSKKMIGTIRDLNEYKDGNSIPRMKRANQLIDISLKKGEEINESTIMSWLQDDFNAPDSINHYQNKLLPSHRRMETVFSIIINLSKRSGLIRLGLEGEYKKIYI